jgi:hypothetical protein
MFLEFYSFSPFFEEREYVCMYAKEKERERVFVCVCVSVVECT